MIQIDPTDCKSVLAEIETDPTAFYEELSPSRPGAVSGTRSVLWVRREFMQIIGVPHDSRLTSQSHAVGFGEMDTRCPSRRKGVKI